MLLSPLYTTANDHQGKAIVQDVTDHQKDGIKPGIIRIKFSQLAEKSLESMLSTKSPAGCIVSGLSDFDSLSTMYALPKRGI